MCQLEDDGLSLLSFGSSQGFFLILPNQPFREVI